MTGFVFPRLIFWALALAVLISCASPRYAPPASDGAALAGEERAALQGAMDTALARRARVYDLAWPVLAANTALCPNVSPSIGLVLADRGLLATMAGGLRERDLEALGIEEGLHIVHAMAGAPAGQAGLAAGMTLMAVEGEAVAKPGAAGKAIRQTLEEKDTVTLTVGGGSESRTLTITGTRACAMPVKISQSQAINAHAASGDIVIYTGLIRALTDDALQFVIAHEAAHLAERHPRKYWRNLAVSGGVVTGPLLYAGATLADMGAKAIGQRPDISVTARSLRLIAPWSTHFEAEADYLGLYMVARAGGDLTGAREAFDVFSREAPRSIYTKSTHPVTPERLVALQAAVEEIEAKREAGMPLLPNEVSHGQ